MRESQVVQNESFTQFNKNVHNFGKLLKRVVRFFATLVLFLLLNVVLDYLTHHTKILSVNTFRMLEESLRICIHDNILPILSVLNQHTFCLTILWTCVCVGEIVLVVKVLGQMRTEAASGNNSHGYTSLREQAVSLANIISYRHKVSFLS